MKRYFYIFFILVFVLIVCGCQTNKTRVAEGAGIGGTIGAIAGGIIGFQSGHPVQGAAIGGAIGAGTGAAVGAQINKPTQDTSSQAPGQLTMQQIVDLTKQGVSSDEIIAKIKAANSKYSLTADDLEYLRKQGVSQRVIETMQVSGK
ncbi:MAG: tRNA (adenine(58)-N(1))-methyltransferase non-catalytic subunit TRM6 [Candidatus Omnitrophica bacterium]|nr:tRNA (adenine(58)-N(1))-methyltransferase non-catalytic subunit TRM6 [Candidatus Omnitrophota bacterium]MBU1923517.1 tRNA (adenine(58)-N(1))-methyltransferase non-catalytic subunit TRM6 [Candidatus Omnitrophota bacterium]